MITISTDTLAALVALTSVGVGSECRGEQEAATITREATESILRRLKLDPAVFADKVRDAMSRLLEGGRACTCTGDLTCTCKCANCRI